MIDTNRISHIIKPNDNRALMLAVVIALIIITQFLRKKRKSGSS